MATMNVSLPDSLKAFVDSQVEEGYGTSSEYVRELIRRDKDRLQLRAMMLKGLESPVTGEADDAYFAGLRRRAGQRRKSA